MTASMIFCMVKRGQGEGFFVLHHWIQRSLETSLTSNLLKPGLPFLRHIDYR
jgi:hypothetical protein